MDDYPSIKDLIIRIRRGEKPLPLAGEWALSKVRFIGETLFFTGREFIRDQIPVKAAALTYFTMLSLVPLLIILFVLFRSFGGETLMDNSLKPFLFQFLSPGSGESVSNAIDQLLKQGRSSAIGSVGFLLLVLVAFSLMDQIETSLNAIWAVKKRRPILRKFANYWVALSVFPLLVGASVSVSAYLGSIERVQEISERVVPQGYNLVPLILQGLAFFLIYILLPHTRVRFSAAFTGAVIAAILWELLKKGYLLYTTQAINYNLIYGSLAALPLFMIWLFISWMAVLLGAEISFVLQNFKMVSETKKRMLVPFQVIEALALQILIEVSRKFLDGGKPFNLDKYAESKDIPKDLLYSVADKIADEGLVKVVDDEVIMSRDPETLTLEETLTAVKKGGAEEPPFGNIGNIAKLRSFIDNLLETSKGQMRQWNLKSLVSEIDKWENEG